MQILQRLLVPSMRVSSVAISTPYNISTRRRHRNNRCGTPIQTGSITRIIGMPLESTLSNENNVKTNNCNNTNGMVSSDDDDDYYYYDDDNANPSSCGEDEPFPRRRHYKNQRRKKHNSQTTSSSSTGWRCRYNMANNRQQGIPRYNNIRIRNLIDRINQEILKIKRKTMITKTHD